MLKIIGRHWRGDVNFWVGLVLFSILLPLGIMLAGSQWLGIYTLQDTPRSRLFQGIMIALLFGAVAIWQLVGTWRASAKKREPARWMLTRWIARLTALGAAGLMLALMSLLPKGMADLYAMMTDRDQFGRQGYSVAVDGNQLVVNGAFAWGLLDKAGSALAENGQITEVVLDSGGGHVGVGTRLGDMIKARNLDTFTTEHCESACTDAFMAGKNRYLRKGAKLGFHSVGGDSANAIEMGKKRSIAYLKDSGLTDDFITRIFETPAESIWYPTYDELRKANVVTEIVE